MSTDDLPRLARAVKQRRLALYPARLKAAQQADISKDTWKRVEEALPVRPGTYAAIEVALRWAPGSCEDVLAGGDPVLVEPSTSDPAVMLADVPAAGREVATQRIVESATIAETDLSADKIRELSARIVGDLRREGII